MVDRPTVNVCKASGINFAKAFSPSHAALTYSLYMLYKLWRESSNLPISHPFKGFQSNRFGRTPNLAVTLLEEEQILRR